MTGKVKALLPLLFAAASITAYAEQLIPAGSLVQCTVSEPKLSSKTAEIGDPVLCRVSHVELYGRSVFPYGSYLVGRFEDYKDPGHLVGKGWMELKFDRMVIPPDGVLPIAAKVVNVPGYPVDKEGRIHGKGHPIRDIVEWSIPLLWPIDLLNLPRRGPRPTLKAETRLTIKIMDDFGVPQPQMAQAQFGPAPAQRDQYGFAQRSQQYQNYTPQAYAPQAYTPQAYTPQAYAPQPPTPPQPEQIYYPAPMQPATIQRTPVLTALITRDGSEMFATQYWLEAGNRVRYIATNGAPVVIPMAQLDLATTVEINRRHGINFLMENASY